jgi:acyl-CoA thioesterase-1
MPQRLSNFFVGGLVVFSLLITAYFAWPKSEVTPPESTQIKVAPRGAERTILALGDSLTAGYGLAESESYPAQLQAKLETAGYANYRVINAGVSGATTADLASSFAWSLQNKPEIVIVVIGANDMLRGVSFTETEKNLRTNLAGLQSAGIKKIVLGGMLASRGLGESYVQDFDSLYPRLAKELGVTLMPFFLADVALDPALNQADGIHPTSEGYAIIVDNLRPYLVGWLEK